jgi:tRNA 2-thiouridine synthesizing protein B
MAMLHVVNKSPFERNTLESCLRLAKSGSSVLLTEDGVIGALKGTQMSEQVSAKIGDLKFYVLGADVLARGRSEGDLLDGVQTVDYGGFVDLVAEHENVQSWL